MKESSMNHVDDVINMRFSKTVQKSKWHSFTKLVHLKSKIVIASLNWGDCAGHMIYEIHRNLSEVRKFTMGSNLKWHSISGPVYGKVSLLHSNCLSWKGGGHMICFELVISWWVTWLSLNIFFLHTFHKK